MQIINLWDIKARVIFVILFFPLFLLSLFNYSFNRLFILFVIFFAVSGLISATRLIRGRLKFVLLALSLILVLWTAYYTVPEFNFLLTSSIRKSIVERTVYSVSIPTKTRQEIVVENKNSLENLLLGKATAYISQDYKSVYFDYYKRGSSALHQAAFFVYTDNAKSIDPRYDRLRRLQNNWFFLVRGYAD